MARLWAMSVLRRIVSHLVRIVSRRCGWIAANRCGILSAAAVVAVVGSCLALFGAPSPSMGGEGTWGGDVSGGVIAPPRVSTLQVAASNHGVHAVFRRTILDRVEASLSLDASTGVGLSARVGVVDLVPLDVIVGCVWRGPLVFAANWRLGPVGIHLQRVWEAMGTVGIGSTWAVTDRLVLGGGWIQRWTAGDRPVRGWVVWVEIFARRQWLGWTVWIENDGCGVSWQRSWAG